MKNPEILAPAGSMEALYAALRCGADAVYVGAKDYSARNSAVNFDLSELRQAAELCHLYNAKLHLAVNTLLTDSELSGFAEFICSAAECGIDACIVQDLGIQRIIKSLIPELPLHASTQMSIHTPNGALQAKALGCSRVVAAREMSREDLAALCRLPVETEVFVHGALCMSVSGQCSFSSIVGGRSANRGKCAQACRLPWKTPGGKNPAALSLKDLSLVEHVRELREMGVDSFKIEGRMKRPEYVAAAVTALRMALHGERPDMDTLQAAFSRSGFTDGYFTGKKQHMFGFRTKEDVLAGQKVLKSIQNSYQKPRTVTALDFILELQPESPAMLRVSDTESHEICIMGDVPQSALKSPLTEEQLRKQFQKLGDTVYECRSVRLENPAELVLSASQCNALRRKAAETMNAERIRNNTPIYEIFPERFPEILPCEHIGTPRNRLHVRTSAQLKSALQMNHLICIPLPLAGQCTPDMSIWIESPRIIADESAYLRKLEKLYQKGFQDLLCHNLADIHIGKQLGFVLHGGFGLNFTNSVTAQSLREMGVQDMTISYESGLKNIHSLEKNFPCGAYLYGRLPMMLFRINGSYLPPNRTNGLYFKGGLP